MPTVQQARHWLDRWDRQQEFYLADREERFAVIADVVEAACGAEPLVVDLGVGPGSLAVRLLDRLPGARVVGIDAMGCVWSITTCACRAGATRCASTARPTHSSARPHCTG